MFHAPNKEFLDQISKLKTKDSSTSLKDKKKGLVSNVERWDMLKMITRKRAHTWKKRLNILKEM